MRDIYQEIYNLIESGKTLVLPTEMAARSLLERYVREKKRPVSFSSAIAFDTFTEELFKRDATLKKADSIIRLLFSKNLIENYSGHLTYFIPNNGYEELKERMVYYIASSIPHFEDEGDINKNALNDVAFIKAKYLDFLSLAGYYEPSYVKGLENKAEKDYVLLFSQSSERMLSFYNDLNDKSHVEIFHMSEDTPSSIYVYDNEKMEIRNTLLCIKEDIKAGVSLDKIAIVVSNEQRIRPYLERDAYLLDIPLMFMRGKSALDYPAGSIYRGIKELYDTDFDIESLEKFLLSSSYPLRHKEGAKRFILDSITMGIKKRGKDNRYRYADKEDIYHDTEHYVLSINETSDPEYLINQIKSLFEKLLIDEQFSLNEEDERVSSYLMDSLESFSQKVKELRSLNLLEKKVKLFPLFIKYAESTIYVPRSREKGIRVFPLGEDNGIYIEKRYVISLNESDARLVKKNISYLSDYELEGKRVELDVTKSLLETYKMTSGSVIYSASENTYSGYVLPLLEFKNKEKAEMKKDSLADEHTILKKRSLDYDIYPITKNSHAKALDKSLSIAKAEDDITVLKRKKNAIDSRSWIFSASQMDEYVSCPFSYYSKYILHLKNSRDYQVALYPRVEIGLILHKVIELYYKNGRGDEDEKVEEYLSYLLGLWKHRKGLDRNMKETYLDPSFKPLTNSMSVYILNTYKGPLASLIRELNERDGSFSSEEKIEGKIEGYNFKGFIDFVIDYDLSSDLIDFKTSSAPSKSLQFDIYSYLYGKTVSDTCYAVIKDGKIKNSKGVLPAEEVERQIKQLISNIEDGDFHGVNTAKDCKGCYLRGLCRRRFFVR